MSARRQPSYLHLLLGLLLFLLVAPLAEVHLDEFAELVITTMLVVPVALGVWAVKRGTRSFYLGVVLLALMIVVQAVNVFIAEFALEPLMLAIATFFFLSLALVALEDVILGGPIDRNRLVGAVCIYLLLGIAWALLFAVFDALTAEPLFSNVAPREGTVDFAALLYYSLVTLTTLGYGDIAPLGPLSRMLAALEATLGQLYLTILVAALVGKLLASSTSGGGKRDEAERRVGREHSLPWTRRRPRDES